MLIDIKNKLLAASAISAVVIGASFSANADHKSGNHLKDESFVTLSGTVEKIERNDQFVLKYNNGTIDVDTSDEAPGLFNGDLTNYLNVGDMVMVSGIVDDNFIADKEIDATIVDVNKNGYITTYRSDSVNKTKVNDDYQVYKLYETSYLDEDKVRVAGYINKITEDDEFVLSYGTGTIMVETNNLNIMKSDKFNIGDYVIVKGTLDKDLFESTEIDADSITRVSYYYGS